MNKHIDTLKELLSNCQGQPNLKEESAALTAAIADMERLEIITTYLQIGGDPRLIVSGLTTFPNGGKKVKYTIEWDFIKYALEENSEAVAAMKGETK